MNKQRIGIFGGTFDPPHRVHLHIASQAKKQFHLDYIYFVPTYIPPHKKHVRITPVSHRVAMLKFALRTRKYFKLSQDEIKRKGVSYSLYTLQRFKRQFPSAELFLILGSDSLDQLHTWKEPRKIIAMAKLLVYKRLGYPVVNAHKYPLCLLKGVQNDVSSTEIRNRIWKDRAIRNLVLPAVWKYIKSNSLYTELNTIAPSKIQHE